MSVPKKSFSGAADRSAHYGAEMKYMSRTYTYLLHIYVVVHFWRLCQSTYVLRCILIKNKKMRHMRQPRATYFLSLPITAILAIYFKQKLHYSEDTATVIYHAFSMFCYFTPIFGALLADQFLGKFK